MTLPARLIDTVFQAPDAHTLCGIAIGDSFAALALPDFWNDSHSDGKVRHGMLEVGADGIEQLSYSVTDTLGRVSRVEVTVEIEDEEAEKRVLAELRDLLKKRTGLAGSKERKTTEWPVKGAYESRVGMRLASFSMDGGRHHRIELYLCLAPGFEITADEKSLFIDVRALTEVLASEAWPAQKAEATLRRYFSKDRVWSVDDADRKEYIAILDAAKEARPDELPRMMERVCALVPWNDVDKGRDAVWCVYPLKEIGAYSMNLSASRGTPAPGRWLRTNPLDVVCMVQLLNVPPAERGAWAAKVVRALEWGEPAAMEAIRERLKAVKPASWAGLVWDAADEVEARAFDLMTSALATDEERALWPLQVSMYDSSAARACLLFFAERGVKRSAVKVPRQAEDRVRTWTEYALFLKTHFPARFDDAFARLFDKQKHYPVILRAMCDQVADEKDTAGGKTTWQIGQNEVSHSGDPERGRWGIRAAKPAAKPKAKPTAKPRAAKAKAP